MPKKHLIQRFIEARETGAGPSTLVIGHRGGYINGPENTMKCFLAAIDSKVEGIEFDVWLSKDNVPMIVHGGDNGELGAVGYESAYVFDHTREEIQTQIDLGEGQTIPTLEELLVACAGHPDLLLNFEMKAPVDPQVAARYDHKLAARIVCNEISKYGVAAQTMVSSFQAQVLAAVHEASLGRRDFFIQSLRNFDLGPDPEEYTISESMNGVNVVDIQLTEELTRKVRESQGLLGVWYYAPATQENDALYRTVFETHQVDFFYSDKPLEAMAARNQIKANSS